MTNEHETKLFIPSPVPAPLLKAARALRRTMTDAEQLLWHCLRDKQLDGFRFRRQHPFERFVLDFYCCEAKLALELDGGQHNQPDEKARDNERTAFLNAQGVQVLRFWNSEVFSNLDGVLQRIHDALTERESLRPPPPPPWPSPAGGGDDRR
jgi:very-short-patch-repair endonuclease